MNGGVQKKIIKNGKYNGSKNIQNHQGTRNDDMSQSSEKNISTIDIDNTTTTAAVVLHRCTCNIKNLYLPPNFKKHHTTSTPTKGQRLKNHRYIQWTLLNSQKVISIPSSLNAFYIGSCRYATYSSWKCSFPGRLHSTKEILYLLTNLYTIDEQIRQIAAASETGTDTETSHTRYEQHLHHVGNCVFGDIYHQHVVSKYQTFLSLMKSKLWNPKDISQVVLEISSRKVYYRQKKNSVVDPTIPYNYHYTNHYQRSMEKMKTTTSMPTPTFVLHELTDDEIEKDILMIVTLIQRIFVSCRRISIIPHVNLPLAATNSVLQKRNALVQVLKKITSNYHSHHIQIHIQVVVCEFGVYLKKWKGKNNSSGGSSSRSSSSSSSSKEEVYMEDVMRDGSHWNKLGQRQMKHFIDATLCR